MATIIKQARSTGPGSTSIVRGADPKNLDKKEQKLAKRGR